MCSDGETGEYPALAQKYRVPIVVTGFEAPDILEGIRRTIRQLRRHTRSGERLSARSHRGGQYRGESHAEGSLKSPTECGGGIGMIPGSGWRLSEASSADYDAEQRFSVDDIHTEESSLCHPARSRRGLIKPHECPAFGRECTPRPHSVRRWSRPKSACVRPTNTRSWRLDLVAAPMNEQPINEQNQPTISTSRAGLPLPLRNQPTVVPDTVAAARCRRT